MTIRIAAVVFLVIAISTIARGQLQNAQYIKFTSSYTSFPDTGRKNGYMYDSVFLDAKSHYNDSSVLMLVPAHFSPKENIDLVFWFHGWRNNIDTAIVFYELSKQFIASGRNAILVLPETAKDAPDSYGGKLEQPGVFSLLVSDILDQLKERKIIPSQARPGRITIAGHSGGFRVIAQILQKGKLPIHEVLLFDGLYGQEFKYMNWIKENPGNVFVHYYTDNGGTYEDSMEFMEQLQKEKIPFIRKEESKLTMEDLKNNRVIFVHSPHQHNYIINKPDNFQLLLEAKK
ncbi:MAG: hypothetical protein C5B59_13520 [Bacteroidetes bacterium]|nr:MAG: hypothetical protein C5B59_13520 [Bacteroidota bacterium]